MEARHGDFFLVGAEAAMQQAETQAGERAVRSSSNISVAERSFFLVVAKRLSFLADFSSMRSSRMTCWIAA